MNARKWQDVNRQEVDDAIESEQFINKSGCGCDIPIHTFRKPGEVLEGRVRPCYDRDRNDRARCGHLYYYDKNGDEAAVAIRLSAMLWHAINDEPKLWGQWIRITYKGSQWTRYGHAKKIYLVEVDKGTITENFTEVKPNVGRSRKPRKPRQIRRPVSI